MLLVAKIKRAVILLILVITFILACNTQSEKTLEDLDIKAEMGRLFENAVCVEDSSLALKSELTVKWVPKGERKDLYSEIFENSEDGIYFTNLDTIIYYAQNTQKAIAIFKTRGYERELIGFAIFKKEGNNWLLERFEENLCSIWRAYADSVTMLKIGDNSYAISVWIQWFAQGCRGIRPSIYLIDSPICCPEVLKYVAYEDNLNTGMSYKRIQNTKLRAIQDKPFYNLVATTVIKDSSEAGVVKITELTEEYKYSKETGKYELE